MPEIQFYFRMFTNDFNKIAQRGREKGLKNELIETMQEEYMSMFIHGIMKANDMPLEIKKKILDNVKIKLDASF